MLVSSNLDSPSILDSLGHRTVPMRSNFECFWLPALLGFTRNVHRDPPSICWSTQTENCALWAARGSLCTFCVKLSKAGKRKHSKFDRFGNVGWPEHPENRDLTRPTSKSCKLLHFKHCNKLLEGIARWLRNILICCVTNLEHGCRTASKDKTFYWIRLGDNFHSLLLFLRIHASYFTSNSQIRTIMQYGAEVNDIQHSCGDVHRVTHKVLYN